MVERRKQIEIEEQEIRRKEKELISTVKLPAESDAYIVQTIAEGKRYVRQARWNLSSGWCSAEFSIPRELKAIIENLSALG